MPTHPRSIPADCPEARRIAFFGGSFDPPHLGHIAIATAAADRFQLDEVLFAPVADQPLKPTRAIASFADRLAMVKLACAPHLGGPAQRFRASDLDRPRPDGQPNYTIDTLTRLRSQLAPQDKLFCLVGADAFLDLPRWRDPAGLLAICEWIVASRPGFALPPFANANSERVHILEGLNFDISATAIRAASPARSLADLAAREQLSPSVAEYIERHRLYGAR